MNTTKRMDALTRKFTVFNTFNELLNAEGNYRPTLLCNDVGPPKNSSWQTLTTQLRPPAETGAGFIADNLSAGSKRFQDHSRGVFQGNPMKITYNPAVQFPMRPVEGGPLPKAPKKLFRCSYEAKVNGRRVMLKPSTKEAWNRHGEKSSALIHPDVWTELEATACGIGKNWNFDPENLWFDGELIHNRLPEGQGSIFVLDVLINEIQERRRQELEYYFPVLNPTVRLEENKCYLTPAFSASASLDAWKHLRQRNKELGYELFEGLVAKASDSLYIPIKSPDEKSSSWIKHRWWNNKS